MVRSEANLPNGDSVDRRASESETIGSRVKRCKETLMEVYHWVFLLFLFWFSRVSTVRSLYAEIS